MRERYVLRAHDQNNKKYKYIVITYIKVVWSLPEWMLQLGSHCVIYMVPRQFYRGKKPCGKSEHLLNTCDLDPGRSTQLILASPSLFA